MINWIHDLPIDWLIVVVVGAASLITIVVYGAVMTLAQGTRGPTLQISTGMLPPIALVFSLLVGFLVAQLWNNDSAARTAVTQEASSLRTVVLLGQSFPSRSEAAIDQLVREHIHTAATQEWPEMARQTPISPSFPTLWQRHSASQRRSSQRRSGSRSPSATWWRRWRAHWMHGDNESS